MRRVTEAMKTFPLKGTLARGSHDRVSLSLIGEIAFVYQTAAFVCVQVFYVAENQSDQF